MVAGCADACLHSMAIMQAYQAYLLKDLDVSERVKPNDIHKLHQADLSLHVTKETAPRPHHHPLHGSISDHIETFVAESPGHWG